MKKLYTSYYANMKNLEPEMVPVAVSQGLPKWYSGLSDKRLAPTWKMMKMSREDYDREFWNHLQKLDAREIYRSLPDNAVMLCYEKFNDWCHRRMVAEWLEQELGLEVCEVGLSREQSFPYAQCNAANKGKLRQPLKPRKPRLVEETKREYEPEAVRIRKESMKPKKGQLTIFDLME